MTKKKKGICEQWELNKIRKLIDLCTELKVGETFELITVFFEHRNKGKSKEWAGEIVNADIGKESFLAYNGMMVSVV